MTDLEGHKAYIINNGFTVINDIYTATEVDAIIILIEAADQSNPAFRKTKDLFAIRRFLKEIPSVKSLIFNDKLKALIENLFEGQYFIVKSIYFDKPEKSNWFVAWHQDLTISVDKKVELNGFGPWTVKSDQFAVQPPLEILQNIFTIRIHLDDTDESNGALRVIPGSHQKGVWRTDSNDWSEEKDHSCNVKKGGVNLIRPLLMHASNRSTANQKRRVIHIEFSNCELPVQIDWAEKEMYSY